MYNYDYDSIYEPRKQMVGAFPSDVRAGGMGMGPSGGMDNWDLSTDAQYQEMLRMLQAEHEKQKQKKSSGSITGLIDSLGTGYSAGGASMSGSAFF